MCISHFIFFANDLLLAVYGKNHYNTVKYFILILDYRNDARQKANLSNFLFKMAHKAGQRTRHSNTFGPGTDKEWTVQQ